MQCSHSAQHPKKPLSSLERPWGHCYLCTACGVQETTCISWRPGMRVPGTIAAVTFRPYQHSGLSHPNWHQPLLYSKPLWGCSTAPTSWWWCKGQEKQPVALRFAVSYYVLLLGWQVPSLVVLLLASFWDFAALLLSASKSWCQSVAQAQWLWISGFGSQKLNFFLECF